MSFRIFPLALGTIIALGATTALAEPGDDASASDDGAPTQAAAPDAGQESGQGPRSFVGADVGFLVPVGNLGDATGVMLGGLVKYARGLSPSFGITGRIGYLYGLDTSTTVNSVSYKYGLGDVPIWVGARYFVSGKCQGFHIGGELGLNVLTVRAGDTSTTRAKVGFNVLPGYRIGDFDIQAQLSLVDIGHPGDTVALGATVGYDFAKF
jgi:hypothetical protein